MRKFIKRPVLANSKCVNCATEQKSRVVAIQLDVEIPEGVSVDDVIDFIQDAAGNSNVQEFHIAGSGFVDDLTEVYESQYPDLLVYRE